ncbi:MAG: hypothetical protein AVDCRST_MAG41-94 [uncultured Corynebacteriales bacterium]|uniref:Low molecular weight protein antigen 6 PH domain-containing protein n=1 Tax=uncultured Mycobacteriales bacterium TaxID=581187 RepID=A0A6J4H518_9ACTN|nr:MAG: hypothetical protein AVDCRST_MAG41-94 [uncultured Corynebacteriales bacterium]
MTAAAPGDGDPLLRIRMPRQSLIGLGTAAFVTLPLVFAWPWLAPLWLVPVVGLVAVLRSGVDADRAGLTVHTLRGARPLRWDGVRGLRIRRNTVWAVLADDSAVRLPVVRPRHLPLLASVSGGRLPDPSAGAQ